MYICIIINIPILIILQYIYLFIRMTILYYITTQITHFDFKLLLAILL